MSGKPIPISSMTAVTSLVGTELFPLVFPGNDPVNNANFNITASNLAQQIGTLTNVLPINLGNATTVTGVLAVVNGGLGTGSLPINAVLLGNGTAAIAAVPMAATGLVLTSQGSTLPPAWATVSLSAEVGLSVLGVAGTAMAQPTGIAGVTDQVLRVDHNGTTLAFGAINLATSAAVTGVLAATNVTAANLASSGVAGGIQGILGAANVTAANLASSGVAGGVQGLLPVGSGGIGTTSLPLDGVVLGNSTSALTVVAATTAGYVLTSAGSTNPPIWTTGALANQTGLSVLGVAGTATAQPVAIVGTTDQVLRVAQNGTTLGFGAINLATSAAVTGVLTLVNGGIGTTNLTAHGVVIANATNPIYVVAATTAGHVLTSQGSTTDPSWPDNLLMMTAGGVQVIPNGVGGTSPIGGNATAVLALGPSTTFGIYFGMSAPTVVAGTGSLYMRVDATNATNRLYMNTNGSTSWTSFIATG